MYVVWMISLLKIEQAEELEGLLALAHGAEYRGLAKDEIRCMFSGDFRKPIFFVYTKGTDIIGAIAISEELFTVDTWGISWVSVHPDYQKRGIGSELVRFSVDEIARRVTVPSSALLSVYPEIADFYRKLGFAGQTEVHGIGGGYFLSAPVRPRG